MVVLIVGLSLGGYIIYKYFGRNAGILLGGLLGGAISSTATTVSYARGTRNDPLPRRNASIVIMIASAIMYVRILVAVTIVSPGLLADDSGADGHPDGPDHVAGDGNVVSRAAASRRRCPSRKTPRN